jgi:O-antigen biosynthesis protein
MESKISFVVPSYNHADLLTNLLMDILTYNSEVDEVVVIENGSTEAEIFTVYGWWQEHINLPLVTYTLKDNIGFLRACNYGVSKAIGDIIVLVSNDVRIERPILAEVKEKTNGKSLVGARLIDWDSGWNRFGAGVFSYLEGYLLAFTRETWNNLGGFDEQYAPYDFDDMDLSTSALVQGYSLVTLNSDKILHLGGKTIGFNAEREKITLANKEKFRQKWIK